MDPQHFNISPYLDGSVGFASLSNKQVCSSFGSDIIQQIIPSLIGQLQANFVKAKKSLQLIIVMRLKYTKYLNKVQFKYQ